FSLGSVLPCAGNDVLLVAHGSSNDDIAVVDDHRYVAEYKVDGAVDIDFGVDLAVVAFDAGSVHHRLI
ncbi:hypothetical protein KI387_020990, partial [Taxus chinensis]